jgi:NADPH-dependent ferric siderophore reductase
MTAPSPYVLARVSVSEVVRLSPAFIRVVFAGPDLAQVGIDGPIYDQRIKLIFPSASGTLPTLAPDAHDWYAQWTSLPEERRGSMRTYSIRHLTGSGDGTRLAVDFVLHLSPGLTGPASAWADAARRGDEILLLAPRRGQAGGGIEFDPEGASSLLLVGDETAAPAIARILEDLPAEATGDAFIEVPGLEDRLAIDARCDVRVHWLPRDGAEHGEALLPAVLRHLGAATGPGGPEREAAGDELVWETPEHPPETGREPGPAAEGLAGGDDTRAAATRAGAAVDGATYAWIAGESGVVTALRRRLVGELGFERSRVAFMGYWRRGVAMRS